MRNSAQKKFKSDLKYVYADNDTLSIIFQSNENLLGVVGEFNNNLKELEKLTSSSENPLIAQVAGELKERLKNATDQDSEEACITRIALCELYHFAKAS